MIPKPWPMHVLKATDSFNKPKEDEQIIPVHWFDERPKIEIRLPFCQANERERAENSLGNLMNTQIISSIFLHYLAN